MSFKLGSLPVGNPQKVGQNQRPNDPKRSFTVQWEKTTATIAQVVGINGVAHITIENPSLLTVSILFNDHFYKTAEKVQIGKDGSITAQWKVTPYRVGNFSEGKYDVEIKYGGGGWSGKTKIPLKIVAAGGDRNVSSFG